MAKLSLTDVAAGYQLVAVYNANNALIEAALENTVSRDGTTPNTLSADLDANSQQITNMPVPTSAVHAASKSYVDGLIAGVQSAGDFSEALAYVFTNTTQFTSLVQIQDTGQTAGISFSHNGTNAQTGFSGTTDWDIVTLSGAMWLRDGASFKISDASDADFMEFSHDGTNFIMDATNTTYLELMNGLGGGGIKLAGSLYINEKADANADIAGMGQIWVDQETPNELMFTDDSGQDTQITRNGGLDVDKHVLVVADESKATDTDLAGGVSLTSESLDANTWYRVKVSGEYKSNVGNFLTKFSNSQTVADEFDNGTWRAVDETAGSVVRAVELPTTGFTESTLADLDEVNFEIEWQFLTHATLASTVSWHWSQASSDAGALILRRGTSMTTTNLGTQA